MKRSSLCNFVQYKYWQAVLYISESPSVLFKAVFVSLVKLPHVQRQNSLYCAPLFAFWNGSQVEARNCTGVKKNTWFHDRGKHNRIIYEQPLFALKRTFSITEHQFLHET